MTIQEWFDKRKEAQIERRAREAKMEAERLEKLDHIKQNPERLEKSISRKFAKLEKLKNELSDEEDADIINIIEDDIIKLQKQFGKIATKLVRLLIIGSHEYETYKKMDPSFDIKNILGLSLSKALIFGFNLRSHSSASFSLFVSVSLGS